MKILKKILAGLIVLLIISLTAWGMYEIMGDALISLMQVVFIVIICVVALFAGMLVWKVILYLLNYIIKK